MSTYDTMVIAFAASRQYPNALALLPLCDDPAEVRRVLGLIGLWHTQRPDAPFDEWFAGHAAEARARAAASDPGATFAVVPPVVSSAMHVPLVTRP